MLLQWFSTWRFQLTAFLEKFAVLKVLVTNCELNAPEKVPTDYMYTLLAIFKLLASLLQVKDSVS